MIIFFKVDTKAWHGLCQIVPFSDKFGAMGVLFQHYDIDADGLGLVQNKGAISLV